MGLLVLLPGRVVDGLIAFGLFEIVCESSYDGVIFLLAFERSFNEVDRAV